VAAVHHARRKEMQSRKWSRVGLLDLNKFGPTAQRVDPTKKNPARFVVPLQRILSSPLLHVGSLPGLTTPVALMRPSDSDMTDTPGHHRLGYRSPLRGSKTNARTYHVHRVNPEQPREPPPHFLAPHGARSPAEGSDRVDGFLQNVFPKIE
jgi:hypothetical protein